MALGSAEKELRPLRESGIALVFYGGEAPLEGVSQVLPDRYRAGLELTRFLLSRKRTRIAFIGMLRPEEQRVKGYRDALAEAGIAYDPELIEQCGGDLPRSGWNWEEFLELIRTLRAKLEPESVCVFLKHHAFWRNLLFRAGGAILDRDGDGNYRVCLDDPRSREGLRRIAEFAAALRWPVDRPVGNRPLETGKLALVLASREDLDYNSKVPWQSVPFPLLPGGADRIRTAADLLCVRRIVNDFGQIRELLKQLLSPEIQNRAGELRYGIPIRRSAAIHSLHDDDPRDRAFFSEMLKTTPDHSLEWPEINQIVSHAIPKIWQENADPDRLVDELAPALRIILSYTN